MSCNPFYSIIQTEESPGVLCSGRSHICPFGTTAYAHVLAELNISKLHPKSLKVYLIGYYGHEAYKLLDRSTEEIFKSRDVIFEEGSTHYATQPTPTRFDERDDLFTTKLPHQLEEITADELENNQQSDSLPMQGIAPRSLDMPRLHSQQTDEVQTEPVLPQETQEVESIIADPCDIPLALKRTRQGPKSSTWLKESHEYLNQPIANFTDTNLDNWLPTTYNDAIKRADLWLNPMTKEYSMLKEYGVFEVVPRPLNKNVVESKWVFAIKWNKDETIEKWKACTMAKGYTQVIGEDYEKTYTSVARLESI